MHAAITNLLLNFLFFPFFFADPANLITSGPYGLIFASFVPFFFDIPVSTRFRVFGVRFSDKSFIYLAGLQVKTKEWVDLIIVIILLPAIET